MNYGARIRELRSSRGLKAKFVAAKLGLSSAQYCDLEKGRKKLTADIVARLACILDVKTDDILCPEVSGTLNSASTGTDGP